MRVDKTLSELWDLAEDLLHEETAKMAINTINKLQDELKEWETGQRQTSKAYKAYRDRGLEIYNQSQTIEQYEEALKKINTICTKYTLKGWALRPDKIQEIIIDVLED